MLSIAGRKKKRARSTESSFEKTFAEAVSRKSWHIAVNGERGWPDRYFVGGVWVEFKVLDGWGPQLEDGQPAKLTEIANGGDLVFYCALVPEDHTVIFQPWHKVRGLKSLKGVERFKYSDKRDLKEIFDAAVKENSELRDHERSDDGAEHASSAA